MPERKTIRLTNAEVGKVIGVRGAVVRTIRLQSGASVEIEHGAGDGANRQIYLSGEAQQVEAAERLIWCAPGPRVPARPAVCAARRLTVPPNLCVRVRRHQIEVDDLDEYEADSAAAPSAAPSTGAPSATTASLVRAPHLHISPLPVLV